MRPRRLLIRYAAGLASAFVLTVAEVVVLVAALAGRAVVTTTNVVTLVVVTLLGTAGVALGAVLIIGPPLRWLRSGQAPTPAQVRSVARITRRQADLTVAPWLLAAALLVPLNLDADGTVLAVLCSAILFGVIATVCTSFLFTLRTLRPLLAGVPADAARPKVPGVRTRLFVMWTVCTALPGTAMACLLAMRANQWVFDETRPIDLALLVLALVAVVLGLRAMILVSMSIADPLNEVIAAMADVERGDIDRTIDVYEWSELGRLQDGFNRMLAGLRDRDRVRDLFGRHVGEDVARRALEQNASLEASLGDERDVSVLFVDLVESTRLAVDLEPRQVARVLNDFFRIVVAEVDARHGLVNKFQGDAALAVFGAPLRIDDPESAALATARALAGELGRLPVDFGIGVSAGPVFAGNIGAENRYEYTVVGDAVNEAARLADCAKDVDGRVLGSGTVVERAGAQAHAWVRGGETRLRGRTATTMLYVPATEPGDAAEPVRPSPPSPEPS